MDFYKPIQKFLRSFIGLGLVLSVFILWMQITFAIVEDCGPEFSKSYSNCKRLRVHADAIVMSNGTDYTPILNDLEYYLPDEQTDQVHMILLEYEELISPEAVGRLSDRFLQSRPQWTVYHEEYTWQKHRSNHLIYIRIKNLDKTLQDVAKVLNPKDCSKQISIFKGYHDFDEYGNEHYNLAGYFEHFLGAITVVHINEYAKFIDDGYCPDEKNKHLCAFLPITNCPLPIEYLNCELSNSTCRPGNMAYSGADPNAHVIFPDAGQSGQEVQKRIKRPEVARSSAVGDEYRSAAVFDFVNVNTKKYSHDGLGSLVYTAIFLRRNYDFRTRVAKLVHTFRHSTKPTFGPNEQCVAIHIRHHDRVKPGYDMIKYCNEFVRNPDGTCYNKTDSSPIEPDCQNHWDANYACSAAVPFGGISFGAYLKAAELLMDRPGGNKSRTVFVMTDDGAWVDQEMQPFLQDWNIHVIPAQPKHRSRATINGVTLFASMEMVQQCSGLVGHTVSAFTVLLRAMMCFRHGPKNNIQFGVCPKFYDFRVVGA